MIILYIQKYNLFSFLFSLLFEIFSSLNQSKNYFSEYTSKGNDVVICSLEIVYFNFFT